MDFAEREHRAMFGRERGKRTFKPGVSLAGFEIEQELRRGLLSLAEGQGGALRVPE